MPKKAEWIDKLIAKIKCPNCSEKLIYKHQRKTTRSAVSAEYDEKDVIAKDEQKELPKG